MKHLRAFIVVSFWPQKFVHARSTFRLWRRCAFGCCFWRLSEETRSCMPASAMVSSTILQASLNESSSQLLIGWDRAVPRDCLAETERPCVHSQKRWYAILLFHSHKRLNIACLFFFFLWLLPPDLCSFASSFFCAARLLIVALFFPPSLKRQTCCLVFLTVRQAGKRDVGRDCSAKSAAAERERKLLMNECHSLAAARCSWGHFMWMVSAWVLSAARETKMLRRYWFSQDLWAFFSFFFLFGYPFRYFIDFHLKKNNPISFTVLFQYHSHSPSWIWLFGSSREIWCELNLSPLDEAADETDKYSQNVS